MSYYEELAKLYHGKRESLLQILDQVGIPYFVPKGAYYVLADISRFGYKTDLEFAQYLVKEIGVAVVPGSSFFSQPEAGKNFIRFCFSKKPETLAAASDRLLKLQSILQPAT